MGTLRYQKRPRVYLYVVYERNYCLPRPWSCFGHFQQCSLSFLNWLDITEIQPNVTVAVIM